MSTSGNTNSDKVAIVTGSSRGIGAAIAEKLAADGFTVVINHAGKAAEADALVAKLEEAGGRALAVQADISDAAAVKRLFDTVEKATAGIDVLVNNAGICGSRRSRRATTRWSTARSPSISRARSTRCAKRRGGCAARSGSSTCRRASLASISRLTPSTPPPRPVSRR